MTDRGEKPVAELSREDRKLQRLARTSRGGKELGDIVSGSSESTAELFASEYKPETEKGEVLSPREEQAT